MIKLAYEKGTPAAEYIEDLKIYKATVRSLIGKASADSTHIQGLIKAAACHAQPVRATVMTEDWCGDSACNMPVLARLFEGADIQCTVFHGSDYPELKKYYEDSGDDHIPVISIWDGNGKEIGRWVEQPEAIASLKDGWENERPEFMELYQQKDNDKVAERKFVTLYRLLLEEMAGWYSGGLWKETTREVVESIRPADA
ncbi:MAG: hypothetical protein HN368_08180 [Spirochaetales bacterium]|jgi:hypothetical protein|nr:hypothetical protein [Spirochaetales bacterium]